MPTSDSGTSKILMVRGFLSLAPPAAFADAPETIEWDGGDPDDNLWSSIAN